MTPPRRRAKRRRFVMPTTLQSLLFQRLDTAPNRRALAWYDPQGTLEWRSTSALHERAQGIAARLRELGLRAGDVCIICLPSSEPASTALLATLLNGAVPLLVAPPTLQRFNSDLAAILFQTIERSGAKVVIFGDALEESEADWRRLERRTRFVAIDDLVAADGTRVRPSPSPRAVAALQLTSGTTSLPRIGIWDHRAVTAALDAMTAAMRLRPDDICFNWTPLYHDMGLVNNFLLCLTRGVPLVMMKPHDFVRRPALWLRGLAESRATITWSPNFGFALASERITDTDMVGVSLRRVHSFWNAAERIHLDTIRSFERRFAKYALRRDSIRTNFGCVENVGGATFSSVDAPFPVEFVDRNQLQLRGVATPVPESQGGIPIVGVGKASPGLSCFALGRNGRRLADGRVGELTFLTPSRMLGYKGDAHATRRALLGKYLRTGDLGYVRGDEVFWVGRVRERITVRGKKIDPSDLEALLLRVDGLRPGCFAAFGVDDPSLGTQRLVVVAEVREPLDRRPEDIRSEIIELAFHTLDVAVNEVVLVRGATLAKTSSGKRRHRRFRELYIEGKLAEFAIAAPARRRRRKP